VPVPMIDDLELTAVQWVRQDTGQDFARHRIPGLQGTLHQRLGRASHRVVLSGLLVSDTAADDLAALQRKASEGVEVTFTADVLTALEVQKMVVESLVVEQVVGPAGQFSYVVALAESPPLPAPAEGAGAGIEGVGDLGFEGLDDVLAGVDDQAGALTGALDTALDAAAALADVAGLADLEGLGNPLTPLIAKVGEVDTVAGDLNQTLASLRELLE
jgi:hypothetical protein